MNTSTLHVAALTLAMGLSGAAQAALHDRGGGLIYDDVLNVTWLQNANYGAGSAYDDTGYGYGTTTDGKMSWGNAVAWAANLSYYDSVRNVTYSDWRLPTVKPVNGVSFNYNYSNNGSTDVAYNITSPNSELAYMFYVNLGNQGYKTTTGAYTGCAYNASSPPCLVNVGPFSNLGIGNYWTDTGYPPDANYAMQFNMAWGLQDKFWKIVPLQAWAVRDGDVTTVPEADTWTMLLAGLGLVGAATRRRRG